MIPGYARAVLAARWRRLAVIAILAALLLPPAVGGAQRNREYLRLYRAADPAAAASATHAEPGAADDLLALRRSLSRGDWPSTSRALAATTRRDGLAPLLVLHEADRRSQDRDFSGAREALALVQTRVPDDPGLWYRLGQSYERAALLDAAARAYSRGSDLDPASPWTEGRHHLAMIYQAQQQWQPLADLLGPLLTSASDDDFARPVGAVETGQGIWQGTFLALGVAYEHLGRTREAEATYERVCGLPAPSPDWTLNRMLVHLARLKRAGGDFAAAQVHLRRALDLAAGYPAAYRRTYESDSSAEAERLALQARHEQRLAELEHSADALVRQWPRSAGAWYVLGLARERACDLPGARAAYARAAALAPPGAGSFLEGRPAPDAGKVCEDHPDRQQSSAMREVAAGRSGVVSRPTGSRVSDRQEPYPWT